MERSGWLIFYLFFYFGYCCGFSFVCFALAEHKRSSWAWGYRCFYKTADTFARTTCSLRERDLSSCRHQMLKQLLGEHLFC